MNADGTNQRRLGPDCLRKAGACQDLGYPAWSPNGTLIAFGGSLGELRNHRVEFAEIFVMNANGRGVRQITRMTTSGKPFATDLLDPAWSPDGKQLVFAVQNFAAADPPNRRALFIVNADGSDTDSFSPDGEWITLSRFTDGPYPAVYVMRANGTDVRRVTLDAGVYEPDWGPARR